MSRAQAPLASTDRHLHLLGVADEALCGRRMRVEGERVTVTRFEKVALVLRGVDAEGWMPQALELRKNDAGWLEREARLHEAIVTRAMAHATVVPARPFTVFTDSSSLEARVREQYTRWRRSLSRLAAKSEWALHIYRGPHPVPAQRPYLLRTLLARAPESEQAKVPREQGEHIVHVWKTCSGLATAARRIDAMVDSQQLFSAAFLLPQSRGNAIRDALEQLLPQAKSLGLTYYLEGPRPAFNFV